MKRGFQTPLLVAAMLAVGVLSWWLQLRPPLQVDPSPLATLPRALGDWEGEDVPLEGEVESMLRADFNVQRAYRHALGDVVWLYVGYYGTDRGGRPEHTPRVCYESHGWRIVGEDVVVVEAPGGRFRANEYAVELSGERQLVHFWFRSHRSTGLLGGWDQTADRLLGRLLAGRADGALVRLSTSLRPGEELVTARSRLLQFAGRLEPALATHWPTEHPAGDESRLSGSALEIVRNFRGAPGTHP